MLSSSSDIEGLSARCSESSGASEAGFDSSILKDACLLEFGFLSTLFYSKLWQQKHDKCLLPCITYSEPSKKRLSSPYLSISSLFRNLLPPPITFFLDFWAFTPWPLVKKFGFKAFAFGSLKHQTDIQALCLNKSKQYSSNFWNFLLVVQIWRFLSIALTCEHIYKKAIQSVKWLGSFHEPFYSASDISRNQQSNEFNKFVEGKSYNKSVWLFNFFWFYFICLCSCWLY